MIRFKTLTYKNFQSVGNHQITISLDSSSTTMIYGKNGRGKSTVLEALSYGLFGKPLKKVTLSGLINNTNKKNLLVTVEFEKHGIQYKVVRGQKPSILELWVSDELVDQSANARDYQSKIEYILGMDHKLFSQVIVLNKERYVPFMEQSAADRRKVVEDILDISVFGTMSEIAKAESKIVSLKVQDCIVSRDKLKVKIEGLKRLIENEQKNQDSIIGSIEKEIKDLDSKIEALEDEINKTEKKTKDINIIKDKISKAEKKKSGFEKIATQFDTNIKTIQKDLDFFRNNDICPSCSQDISESIKNDKEHECNSKISDIRDHVSSLMVEYQKSKESLKALTDSLQEEVELTQYLRGLEQEKRHYQAHRESQAQKIKDLSKDSRESEYRHELADLMLALEAETENLEILVEQESNYDKVKVLLKDDGIKASIVKDYIEFINLRINDYLSSMEFHISLTIDENFNEKVGAINRQGFTYDNLSTGQKTRVSLAIWMALLEVANIKNSIVTNILVLDEILEPLDSDGVSMFMDLVREKLPHKNTFVITQRSGEFLDYFDNTIGFDMNEGFTELITDE